MKRLTSTTRKVCLCQWIGDRGMKEVNDMVLRYLGLDSRKITFST